jgi:hypothetical protein
VSGRPAVSSKTMDPSTPTVLWRLRNANDAEARAVLIPGDAQHTLTFFVDDVMDRAENFATLDLALFRAEDIRASMVADGWRDESAAR